MRRDFIGQTAMTAMIQGLLTEDACITVHKRDSMRGLDGYENEN